MIKISHSLSVPAALLIFSAVAIFDISVTHASENRLRAGQLQFLKCQSCHSLDSSKSNLIGPNLANLFGSPAGDRPGYESSEAMRSLDIIWSEETLDAFLKDPSIYAPGNRMGFPGLKDRKKRKSLIEFLKAKTSE